ncbi:MAG: hypothetical protein IJ509_00040 [Bacilli bacterium]|nr:hypothetical protein [Bacilli bacterium]
MLNYMKADLYRIFTKKSIWIWSLALIILPTLLVVGATSEYGSAMILKVLPIGIYIEFIIVSIIVSDYTFREEKELNLYKNDTTCGISKGKIFVSKYLTGILIEIVLWLLCSLFMLFICAISFGNFFEYVKVIFSIQIVNFLLMDFFYLSLFQLLGIFIRKTSTLILMCIVISSVFENLKSAIEKVIPWVDGIFNLFIDQSNVINFSQVLQVITLPIILILIVVFIGSKIFENTEF